MEAVLVAKLVDVLVRARSLANAALNIDPRVSAQPQPLLLPAAILDPAHRAHVAQKRRRILVLPVLTVVHAHHDSSLVGGSLGRDRYVNRCAHGVIDSGLGLNADAYMTIEAGWRKGWDAEFELLIDQLTSSDSARAAVALIVQRGKAF